MSKIEFEDKSYIEIQPSNHPEKVVISIVAKDYQNPLKKITNSVEISLEQLKTLTAQFGA